MVYIGIKKPKKSDSRIYLEIIDHASVTTIGLTKKEALRIPQLATDIHNVIQIIGDKLVTE